MNIGVAANFSIFEKAGVGRYSRNLLKNLLRIDSQNHYFLYFNFYRQKKARLKSINQIFRPKPKNLTLRISSIPAAWLEFLGTTNFPITTIIKDKLDLFFSPYVAGIPKNGFPKMITTVHDLVFLRFPEHRGKRLTNYYLKRHKIALENCQKIIVPSLSTQKDLEDFLKVKSSKIKVIPEAVEERFKVIPEKRKIKKVISRYFDPNVSYILSVGTLEPRKNLIKLVEAYSNLSHNIQRNFRLVLVGEKGWNNSRLGKVIANLNLKEKIILTGFVKDEDLPYIYNGASVFVYPSLYEGFGLPPLEAAACSVPVITSNSSSLKEIFNKTSILVDPENEDEIAQAIKKIILNPALAGKLSKKGIQLVKKFSWGVTAQETLAIFKEGKIE